jgi:exodeoxyribonuclease VII small subunit
MKKNTLTYNTAKAELEKIMNSLKQGTADIDTMVGEVERATELLDFCRERLKQVEAQLTPSDELEKE